MSFEAYSIGIRLHLIDGVSLGILGLSEKFAGLNTSLGKTHTELGKIEQKLKGVKNLMLAGSGLMVGGGIALSMLDGPIKAATAYEVAYQKLKNLNLGEAVNKQADEFARANKTFAVSSTEMMTALAESIGLFPSYAAAMANVGKLTELTAANRALYGEGAGDDKANSQGLMKFAERRGGLVPGADGKFDQAKFDNIIGIAEKMVTGSGGRITFAGLGLFSQQAGAAFRGMSDQGIMDMALAIQEMGASKAGTAYMSLFQNLHAGRTPVKTMNLLEAAGLGATHNVLAGEIAGVPAKTLVMDHIKDAALLQENAPKWIETVMLPALWKMGTVNETQIISAMNDLISTRTASNLGTILGTQAPLVHRDANLVKNAAGINQVLAGYEGNPAGVIDDMQKQKASLEVELGKAALPVIVPLLQELIPVVKGLGSLIQNFPKTSGVLVGSFIALAATAVAGGAIMNIVGGFTALGLGITKLRGLMAAGEAAEAAGMAGMGGMGIAGKAASSGILGFLGKAGAVTGVGALAYGATDLIANQWLGLDAKIGSWLNNRAQGGEYDPNAYTKNRNFVAQAKGDRVPTFHTKISMDGKIVADVVSGHQADAFGPTGGMMFDPTLTPPPVGLNFAR